jgi:hemolysin activation/secretion protein
VVSISFVATTGLDGTRSDVTGLPSPSRDFKVISVATSFARRLDRRQLELRLQLSGQWANGLLYADERLSVGGEFSVRGYRQGLLLADTGVVGSIQLARPFSISGGHRTARGDDLGAFVVSISGDAAAVGYKDNAPSGPRWIASTGISLSWTPMAAFSATGGFAQPLRDVPISGQRDFQDRGFSVRITFRPLLL